MNTGAKDSPTPDLIELLAALGSAGRRLSEIGACEAAAGNLSVCLRSALDLAAHGISPESISGVVPNLSPSAVPFIQDVYTQLRKNRREQETAQSAMSDQTTSALGSVYQAQGPQGVESFLQGIPAEYQDAVRNLAATRSIQIGQEAAQRASERQQMAAQQAAAQGRSYALGERAAQNAYQRQRNYDMVKSLAVVAAQGPDQMTVADKFAVDAGLSKGDITTMHAIAAGQAAGSRDQATAATEQHLSNEGVEHIPGDAALLNTGKAFIAGGRVVLGDPTGQQKQRAEGFQDALDGVQQMQELAVSIAKRQAIGRLSANTLAQSGLRAAGQQDPEVAAYDTARNIIAESLSRALLSSGRGGTLMIKMVLDSLPSYADLRSKDGNLPPQAAARFGQTLQILDRWSGIAARRPNAPLNAPAEIRRGSQILQGGTGVTPQGQKAMQTLDAITAQPGTQ